MSSDVALDGKLFVQFIAFILISYIRKHMIDKKLFGGSVSSSVSG